MSINGSLSYEALFQMISQPLFVANSDKKIIYMNNQALKFLEIPKDQLGKLYFDQIFDFTDKELDNIEELLLSEQAFHGSTNYTVSNTESMTLGVLIKGMPLPYGNRVGYYFEVYQENKITISENDLKILGHRTSEIAHDISNPLAVLRIHCDNFVLKAQKTEQFSSVEILERVKKLLNASKRLESCNEELKSLSKTLIDYDENQFKRLVSPKTNDDFNH